MAPSSPLSFKKKQNFLEKFNTKRYNDRQRDTSRTFLHFIYRTHAIERMFERNISDKVVEKVIKDGKVIEKYLDDKPYPSFLILGYEKDDLKKPLHIVFAKDGKNIIVITAYRPNKLNWTNNYQIRIKK